MEYGLLILATFTVTFTHETLKENNAWYLKVTSPR